MKVGVASILTGFKAFAIASAQTFEACANLDDEFAVIKKLYHKKILTVHPDKGGDAAQFREVQASFEVLREAYTSKSVASFAACLTARVPAAAASSAKAKASTAPSRGRRQHDFDERDWDSGEDDDEDYDPNEDNDGGDDGDFYDPYEEMYRNFKSEDMPSYEYFASAADEVMPTYRIELAKSGRSACSAKGAAKKCAAGATDKAFIDQDSVRIGSINLESGSYGRWVHLGCWRVPKKVWMGLPNPDECSDPLKFEKALLQMGELLICGFVELPSKDRQLVINYVMDKANWAGLPKPKKVKEPTKPKAKAKPKATKRKRDAKGTIDATSEAIKEEESEGEGEVEDAEPLSKKKAATKRPRANTRRAPRGLSAQALEALASVPMPVTDNDNNGTNTSLVMGNGTGGGPQRYVMPVPGQSGLVNSLAGKCFVMTGVFPEIGGGVGLNLGKDRLKAMIQSFGGRVVGSVSGKTDVLIVGKDPGMSKVSQARSNHKTQLLDLTGLTGVITCGTAIEDVKPLQPIRRFSTGYMGNGLALIANSAEKAEAAGLLPAAIKY